MEAKKKSPKSHEEKPHMEPKKKATVEAAPAHAGSHTVTKEKEPIMKTKKPASVPSTSTSNAPTAPAATQVVATMSDAAVNECLTALGNVAAKLGDDDPLSTDEVRRATKMRKGGAEIVPKILALCQQHGITQIGTLSTAEMTEMLDRGNAIMQVGKSAELVQKKVSDATLRTHGRSWQIATTMYTTLKRLALNDPELALGLQEVEGFFQTKKTKGKVRENEKARKQQKLAKDLGVDVASLQAGGGGAGTAKVAPSPAGSGSPSDAAPPAGNAPAPASNAPSGGGAH